MRMGQGVRTGLGHGGITCVLQTQFSSLFFCHKSMSDGWTSCLVKIHLVPEKYSNFQEDFYCIIKIGSVNSHRFRDLCKFEL